MSDTWKNYQSQLVTWCGMQIAVPIGHPGNRITLEPRRFPFCASSSNGGSVMHIVWLPGIRREPIPAYSSGHSNPGGLRPTAANDGWR
jgi:hypothetical protein